ncbi:MAG: hypothetical protein ACXWTP_09095 [Methylosarcina sp.]
MRSENAGFTKSRRVIAQQVLYPWVCIKREEQDGWGAEGKSGRVKFLPLAWAGMPKTSFRKNSDSPIDFYGRLVSFQGYRKRLTDKNPL